MIYINIIIFGVAVYLFIKARKQSRLSERRNMNRKFGSATKYYYVRLTWESEPVDFLFTEKQLQGAADRANDNREDF